MVDFNIVSDIHEARRLWEKFCDDSLWEMPDLVFSTTNEHDTIHFLVLVSKGEEIGLLPLYFDRIEKKYYYFGGSHPENRRFMFNLKYFNEVFDKIPIITRIFDINATQSEEILNNFPHLKDNIKCEDYNFYIDLKEYGTLDNFFKTFSAKHRKNLFNDIKKVVEQKFEVVWEKLENYSSVVTFNAQRFGSESDYSDDVFAQSTLKVFDVLDKKGLIHTVKILDGEKIIGIEVGAFHNNIYYVLNGGYDRSVKNLGKYIMYLHMKKAEELGASKIDFLVGDTGWKALWNLQQKKVYTLRKENE